MIDKMYTEIWYSWFLCRELSEARNTLVSLYGPRGARWKESPGRTVVLKTWTKFLYPLQIAKQIRGDRPNVCHIQFEYNMFGSLTALSIFPLLLLLLRISGTPVVTTLHSLYRDIPTEVLASSKLSPKILGMGSVALLRLVGAFSSAVIIHFEQQRKAFESLVPRYAGTAQVIPHGVEYIDEAPNAGEEASLKQPQLLYFGNITPRKGIEDLIEAVALLKLRGQDVFLTIAGKPRSDFARYLNALKTLVQDRRLENHVRFKGFVEAEVARTLMERADVIVLPARFVIAASGSLSAAKGMAKRIVITRHELLESQLGSYPVSKAEPNDPDDLAEAISGALALEEIALSNGRSREKDIDSWESVGRKTVELYQAALTNQ